MQLRNAKAIPKKNETNKIVKTKIAKKPLKVYISIPQHDPKEASFFQY